MGNSGSAHNINGDRSGINRNSHFQTRFERLSQNSRRQFQWSRSGRRSSPISPQRSLTAEWRRSYPSTFIKKETETSFKVLPELDKRLHLRSTTNGAILNSGGTISGRKQNENQVQTISNSLSQRSKTFINESMKDRNSALNEKGDSRPEFTRSQTLLYIKAKSKDSDPCINESNLSRMQRHTYSESELINKPNQQSTVTTTIVEPLLKPSNRNKYSKKRRAPEAPQAVTVGTQFTQTNMEVLHNTQNFQETAKPIHFEKNSDRLSKLNKQTSKIVHNQTDTLKRDEKRQSLKGNCLSNKSTECPKFAYRREKSSDAIMLKSRKSDQPETSKGPSLNDDDHRKYINRNPTSKSAVKCQKTKCENAIVSVEENKCQRTFYFGMEADTPAKIIYSADTADEKIISDSNSLPMISNYEIEYKEATSLEENMNDNGLLVRIRPTLPRRQVETPSFSPTLAWRALIEEQDRIDKSNIIQNINNWSIANSETPIQPNRTSQIKQFCKPNHLLPTWTPEQDLDDENEERVKDISIEDDSSSDEYRSKYEGDDLLFYGSKTQNASNDTVTPIHTFSLSLPRDSHIQHTRTIDILNTADVCIYKSLQKLKQEKYNQRNSSSHAQPENISATKFESSNNWMLHKNVSGTELYTKSLEHGSKRQRLVTVEPQSIKFLTGGKHVMYLPGTSDQPNPLKACHPEPQANVQPAKTNRHFKNRQRPIPQSLQDKTPIFPVTSMNEEGSKLNDDKPFHQRFHFNNPVRLLEKKMNAEKSLKTSKLKMSLDGQLEALKKVEEDFQRNRANEKENIQHQLRLYFGTDDEQYHSLPIAPVLDRFSAINLNDSNNKLFCRDDPEGCVSTVPFADHKS